MVFIHSSERGHNRDCTYCPTSAPPDILHQSRDLYFLRKVRRIVYYVKARVLEKVSMTETRRKIKALEKPQSHYFPRV